MFTCSHMIQLISLFSLNTRFHCFLMCMFRVIFNGWNAFCWIDVPWFIWPVHCGWHFGCILFSLRACCIGPLYTICNTYTLCITIKKPSSCWFVYGNLITIKYTAFRRSERWGGSSGRWRGRTPPRYPELGRWTPNQQWRKPHFPKWNTSHPFLGSPSFLGIIKARARAPPQKKKNMVGDSPVAQ